jgi:uncharacterized membrane protein YdjX (TVP38/TMEM64 family)
MRTRFARIGWVWAGALLLAGALAYLVVAQGPLTLLQAGPGALARPVRELGVFAPLGSLAMNALTVVIPLPGSAVALVNGAVFGPWAGALLNWGGGLIGASLCFWVGRSLAAERLARALSRRPESWARQLERPSWTAIAGLRAAGVSFGFVSYLSGATAIGWWAFLWGTAAGSLPRAAAYAVLGSTLQIPFWATLALGPIAAAGWVAARALRRRRAPRPALPAPAIAAPALPASAGS